ncbi:MAG: hypothetical protein CBC38_02280 [Gammaproteobacteria bacterium TMED78]|nr:MAG: hypothetical protein CBC38_02280 [Gammaproteobacteria bacterium TMED78]|tara:strand:+ start:2343 stop:2987 length:645 start_codon:yes stop_codon:yes gene_type:complete
MANKLFSSIKFLFYGLLVCSSQWLFLLYSDIAFPQGSIENGKTKAAVCVACHGVDGNSINPEWPSLAGQHPLYTAKQLKSFQDGQRQNILMNAFAISLTEQDMIDLAAYYGSLPNIQRGADPELVDLGQKIYRGGIFEKNVPACIACHGPSGKGNPFSLYPKVKGQHSIYTINTLNAYAIGTRYSDSNEVMRTIAKLLSQEEIEAVASYIQGLK